MNLPQKVKHFLRAYDVSPKKRLGQNFMVDEHFLQLMSSYANLSHTDVVLEVGAGFGFLTQFLAEKAKKVIAVEIDARLMKTLRNEFADFDNVELIESNVLKATLPAFNKVVSNPPFSISSPLLFRLLEELFETAILTFQKEFAQRLNAQVGCKHYSRLTVSTYYRADIDLLDPVPREAFYPPPDVDAYLVRLKLRRQPPFKVEDEKVFEEVVRILFTQRNRKVRKAILSFLHKYGEKGTDAIKRADTLPFHNKRVRELAPEDFGALANELIR